MWVTDMDFKSAPEIVDAWSGGPGTEYSGIIISLKASTNRSSVGFCADLTGKLKENGYFLAPVLCLPSTWAY